ncbi:MAG: radical SAM family heme chaperone HemW [Proteobacteria bacterium]|nr:radical SAM family heme chaperone HemW [Pseudomonadota bacterium]
MSVSTTSTPAPQIAAAPGFGVYVHWPFCRTKCPYCDFNVHIRDTVDDATWLALLTTELDHFFEQTSEATVSSIFFGGGTPSLMAAATVAGVIEHVASRWTTVDQLEVSLEANPNDWRRFEALRTAGITRLSLGAQSFDDEVLKFLGRDHTGADARTALDKAQKLFPEASCDLIYALPGQSLEDWRLVLHAMLPSLPEHLSLYQLTIEIGTAFHRAISAGEFAAVESDDAADFYLATQEICDAGGWPAYEVSNHAQPGHQCRHNLTYWRGGDYVGVGPGAHGRITHNGLRTAIQQYRNPESWQDAVLRRGCGTELQAPLEIRSAIEEAFLFGLRPVEGISRAYFRDRYGVEPEAACNARGLAELSDAGFVECDPTGLRATASGRLLLDAICSRLLAQ